MAIYMKYASIGGSSTAQSHEEWITCESISWGGGRAIGTATGSSKNREASMVSISEVVITKAQDNASPELLKRSYVGTDGEDVTIHLTTTSNEGVNTIMELKLTNTLVSGFSVSSGGDRPSESVSMNFTKIESTFHNQAVESTEAATPFTVTYDLATAVAT
ncbi:MAG: type VI secretion system tube protein Hcp [Alphaproteobacteria bacterium]|nr:type VI secretion system tube protein Hcp [Alphaproteobacteria bacterium]MCW5742448.1 type VI secretion system tube protein Hcp [Alphaproteobacteria bacterium]